MKFDNFVGPSYVDWSPNVDAEETINLYLEEVQSGNAKNKTGYVFKRAPGLTPVWSQGTDARCSGMLPINGHVFALVGDQVYDFEFDGGSLLTITAQYPLPVIPDGKKAYFVADPRRQQVVLYTSGHAYCIAGGTMAEVAWPGVALAGVALVNKYFLFLSALGDGFFYSEPGDALNGDASNFRTAEASANVYVSMLVDHEQVWLFGDGQVSQVFLNDASDANEPFKPIPSAVIPRGIGAPASAISEANRVWWIGDNGVAYRSSAYLPERVSTHAIENTWRGYARRDDAVSHFVTFNGHICWRIWFPTADVTWQYDTSLPAGLGWTKVLSWDEIHGAYTAHRGMSSCMAFGLMLIGDRSNGKIYSLSPDVFFDDTVRAPWERRAPVINEENRTIEFPWFEPDMEMGVGDGTNCDPLVGPVSPEADPTILISYSNDGGQTYGNELQRSLGRRGQNKKRAYIARCGEGARRVFRLRGSAACRIVISNVYLRDPAALDN